MDNRFNPFQLFLLEFVRRMFAVTINIVLIVIQSINNQIEIALAKLFMHKTTS
jgi:hypothetical protein